MVRYRKLSCSRKDYDSGNVDTINISNLAEVRKWKRETWMTMPGHKGFERRVRLYDDNRAALRDIFGRASFCWRNGYSYSCWLIDLETAQLLILSAAEKGTCYELVTHRYGMKMYVDIPAVLGFMDWFADKLQKETFLV